MFVKEHAVWAWWINTEDTNGQYEVHDDEYLSTVQSGSDRHTGLLDCNGN